MEDNEFWIKVCKYISIVVCVLIVSGFSSCQSSRYQIRKAVEAGSSAVEAACAFEMGNSSNEGLCTVEILKNQL